MQMCFHEYVYGSCLYFCCSQGLDNSTHIVVGYVIDTRTIIQFLKYLRTTPKIMNQQIIRLHQELMIYP